MRELPNGEISEWLLEDTHKLLSNVQNYGTRKEMVSWSNLEKLCSCSRTWMVSALACGNKWIQVGTYI